MYITNEGFFGPVEKKKEFKDKEERGCAMDAFFRNEEKKVPWLRSKGALLVCRCPKCAGRVIC